MKRLALLAPAVLLLAGCSSIQAGTITAKVIEPETAYYTQQCSFYNSKGQCQAWIPIRHVDDQDWRFDLVEQVDPLDHRDPATGFVYVTAETYDAYEVGDYFDGSASADR